MAQFTVKELVYSHEKAFLPEKAAGLNAVIQYHLTGDEGGDYIITIKNDKCSVTEGTTEDPVITMTANGDYFRNVILGKEDGMRGYMSGKLQLEGNLNLAMKLIGLFKIDG